MTFLNIWRFDTFFLLPYKSPWFIEELEFRNRFVWETKSSLYKRVNLLNHVCTWKNVNFLLILKSKVFIFYCIMADTWCHWNIIILEFVGLLLKKRLNSVYANVSYLSARILNDKSSLSPVIDTSKSKTNTNE